MARDEQIKKLEDQLNSVNKDLEDGVKLQHFLDKLPGQPQNKKIMAFAPLEDIPMVDGKPDELILESKVNEFLKEWGDLIGPANKKRLPNDGANPTSSLSYNEWLKLPLKERKARMKEVFDARYKK